MREFILQFSKAKRDELSPSFIQSVAYLEKYPNESVREEFEVSLAHKKLTEQQLLALCESRNTFECYFELAALYYENNEYDIQKLKKVRRRHNERITGKVYETG